MFSGPRFIMSVRAGQATLGVNIDAVTDALPL